MDRELCREQHRRAPGSHGGDSAVSLCSDNTVLPWGNEDFVTRKRNTDACTSHVCFYLDCFRREKPTLIFEVLERLSQLRRFEMAVMFMSGPERKRKYGGSRLSRLLILLC